MLEGLKWRWFLATHKHEWEYSNGIVGFHHEKGAYITRTCKHKKCRQIETIYVPPNYNSSKQTVKKVRCLQCNAKFEPESKNKYHRKGFCGVVCWGMFNDIC